MSNIGRVPLQVPLEEEMEALQVPDLGPVLRGLAEKDRDVLEKGVKAFVSYIRGYKEHQCQYIFRLQDMDLGALARACALLRLPKMPEVRRLRSRTEGFQPSAVDPHAVKVAFLTHRAFLLPGRDDQPRNFPAERPANEHS